jgi:hypothetical protein
MLRNEMVLVNSTKSNTTRRCSVEQQELPAPFAFLAGSSFRSTSIEVQKAMQPRTGSLLKRTLEPRWFSATVSRKMHGRPLPTSVKVHKSRGKVNRYDIDPTDLMNMRVNSGSRCFPRIPVRSHDGHGVDSTCQTGLRRSEQHFGETCVHGISRQDRSFRKSTDFARRNRCMLLIHDNKRSIWEASPQAKGCKNICNIERGSLCIILYRSPREARTRLRLLQFVSQ